MFNKKRDGSNIHAYGVTDYEGNLERAEEAAEAEEVSNNGQIDKRGRAVPTPGKAGFAERDETPDVLTGNRGVGNLLSKLIDGDGSYLYDEQHSLQNPAQLLHGQQPKREIQKIIPIIRSVKDSESAATNGAVSGQRLKSSKSNSRLLAQNISAM